MIMFTCPRGKMPQLLVRLQLKDLSLLPTAMDKCCLPSWYPARTVQFQHRTRTNRRSRSPLVIDSGPSLYEVVLVEVESRRKQTRQWTPLEEWWKCSSTNASSGLGQDRGLRCVSGVLWRPADLLTNERTNHRERNNWYKDSEVPVTSIFDRHQLSSCVVEW